MLNARRRSRAAVAGSVFLLATGCMQWSPFETDLDEDEQNWNSKNLAALERRGQAPEHFSFAVLSDTHDFYDELADVIEVLNARDDLSFAVHLGDLSTYGLRIEYQGTLRTLQKLRVPFFVIIGNHDLISNGQTIYRAMFGPFDFVIPYGGVRVICFNSNREDFDGTAPDYAWLTKQAELTGTTLGSIMATHWQLSSTNFDVERFLGIARAARTSLYLHGHLHDSEARALEGMPIIGLPSIENHEYGRVTLDRGRPSFEKCRMRVCEPVELPQ